MRALVVAQCGGAGMRYMLVRGGLGGKRAGCISVQWVVCVVLFGAFTQCVCLALRWCQGRVWVPYVHPADRWVGFVPDGQLGNHLFELASVFGIARARNSSWCVMDLSNRYHEYSRHLRWIADPPRDGCPGLIRVNSHFRFTPLFMPVGDDGLYAGYHSGYELSQWPRIRVEGCVQSFRYFDPAIPIPFMLAAAPRARTWVRTGGLTAAIHVRRGDKLTDDGNVVPPLSYFQLAVAELRRRFHGRQAFVVVTDDPGWVREHSFFRRMHVLSSSDPAFDMAVISECRHKILSIGTFGWWGAFLGGGGRHNASVAVIYPVLQMEGRLAEGFRREDYFPQHWIGIDY